MKMKDIVSGSSYRNKRGTYLVVRTVTCVADDTPDAMVYYASSNGDGSCRLQSFANWAKEEITGLGNETPAQTMDRLEKLY